jgi:hypothetical protein
VMRALDSAYEAICQTRNKNSLHAVLRIRFLYIMCVALLGLVHSVLVIGIFVRLCFRVRAQTARIRPLTSSSRDGELARMYGAQRPRGRGG